jgi:hypothetical protein
MAPLGMDLGVLSFLTLGGREIWVTEPRRATDRLKQHISSSLVG